MWTQRYDTETYIFGTAPAQFLVDQQACLKPGQTALVIADGEGRNSTWLAQQGLQVTAMENAETALAKARKLAKARGVAVDFIATDIETWDWQPAKFDVVAAIFIQFARPALRHRIFQGIKHTLKPGGLILLHGFTPEQINRASGGPRVVENLYTTDLLAAEFADFNILRLHEYEAFLTEGPGHNGTAALIDLVATKPA